VICLHGLGRTPADWDGVRAALERFGPVLAPALPRDAAAAAALALRAVPPGAVLIGHSLGAVVALRLAARTDLRVRAVVASSSFFPPARNGRTVRRTLADYLGHRVAFVRAHRAAGGGLRPGSEAAVGLRPLLGIAARRTAFDSTMRAVQCPVLVLHAIDDHYVPVDFAAAAVAGRPSWTLVRLDGGGHYPHRDRAPQWLSAVEPWLERALSGEPVPGGGAPG